MLAGRVMAGGKIWSVRFPARCPAARTSAGPVDRLVERDLAYTLERRPVVVEGEVDDSERRVEKEPSAFPVDAVLRDDLRKVRLRDSGTGAVVQFVLLDRRPAGPLSGGHGHDDLVDVRRARPPVERVSLQDDLAIGNAVRHVVGAGAERVVDLRERGVDRDRTEEGGRQSGDEVAQRSRGPYLERVATECSDAGDRLCGEFNLGLASRLKAATKLAAVTGWPLLKRNV